MEHRPHADAAELRRLLVDHRMARDHDYLIITIPDATVTVGELVDGAGRGRPLAEIPPLGCRAGQLR